MDSRGSGNFPKFWESPASSWCQWGGIKQVPYWGTRTLE